MHLPGSFIKDTGYSRTHLCGFYCLSSGINGNITDPLAVGIIVKIIIIIIIIPRQGFAAIETSITETASSVPVHPQLFSELHTVGKHYRWLDYDFLWINKACTKEMLEGRG